ncbi:unnamed protein product [Lymnaea stagnalis]|uniref:Uncharacterized protein n=1 Tax=Lymnaea stagnalis TaxID=6523 RepID=A0AAV2HI08_LYMST
MGLSKVLPFHSLLLLCYVLQDGATSDYCVKDDESVEYCKWSCCGSEYNRSCCMSPYVIAGIVFGCIAGVCTIAVVIFCFCQYKKQRGQVINYPQSQKVVVLSSGNVQQQQHNGYATTNSFPGYNTQYNATPPTPYTHQANYPPPPAPPAPPVPPAYTAAPSPPLAFTYNAAPSNPFAVAANQAAGRTPTAK